MNAEITLKENFISYKFVGFSIELRKYKDISKVKVKNAIYIFTTDIVRHNPVIYVGKCADTFERNKSHRSKWIYPYIENVFVLTSTDFHEQYRSDIEQFLINKLSEKYDLENKCIPKGANPLVSYIQENIVRLLYCAGINKIEFDDNKYNKLQNKDVVKELEDDRLLIGSVKSVKENNKKAEDSSSIKFTVAKGENNVTNKYLKYVEGLVKERGGEEWLQRVYDKQTEDFRGKIKNRIVAPNKEDLLRSEKNKAVTNIMVRGNKKIKGTSWYLNVNTNTPRKVREAKYLDSVV